MFSLSRWLLFIHILSAVTFFLAHGAAAALVFQVRKEENPERIRAMLDLSVLGIPVYLIAFLLLGLSGIAMPFILEIWDQLWLWLSIVAMLGVFFWMVRVAEHFKVMRKLVGLPYRQGNKDMPAEPPADDAKILEHVRQTTVWQSVVAGYIIPAIVLWLMVFKPF